MIAKYGKFEYALAEHYRFEDELGRGAMGTVYRAKDVKLGRPVAIKMLHPMLTNELGIARFQSEIRIAAGLHHPNIIGVHDSGEADGRLFYVMDYLGGETLRDRLNREKQLSVDDALGIVEQIAEGLQYAHDHGVVHRDIKPENIILAEGRACIVDFGLARALGEVDALRLTASGLSVGTPHYLSPEQAAAEKDVGPKADQYGLACVLFEMLVGEPPFTGPTATSIAMRHITEVPRPIRTRRPTVPAAVESAVRRALEKVPSDRFATVAQFARAFREDLLPSPPRQRKAYVLAAATTLALSAIGIVALDSENATVARGLQVLSGRQLDTSRYVIFPLAGPSATVALDLDRRLTASLSQWKDVSLPGPSELREAMHGEASRPTSASAGATIARRVDAGRFLLGDVTSENGALRLSVEMHDAAGRTRPRNASILMTSNQPNADSVVDQLTYELLFGDDASRFKSASAGTRNRRAFNAYIRGRRAMEVWNLAVADSALSSAIREDADFPQASVALAQVRSWSRNNVPEVSGLVARALNRANVLSSADRLHAAAVLDLQSRRLPEACRSYAELIKRDSADFAAWYGSAECNRRDNTVVSVAGQRRFRGNLEYASRAIERAFDLLPSIDACCIGRANDVLRPYFKFTSTSQFRYGRAEKPDTGAYSAYPEWRGDSLSFTPLPHASLPSRHHPATHEQAVREQRRRFLSVASKRLSFTPRSADALELLSETLELSGDPAAVDTTRRARSLATTAGQALRLGVREVWLRVKVALPGNVGELGAARAVAESLLAVSHVENARDAAALASLAALLGDATTAASLAERGVLGETPDAIPPHVAGTANALLVYAAMGGPADRIQSLEQRLRSSIASGVVREQQGMARDVYLSRALALAYPVHHSPMLADLDSTGDALLAAELAHRRGDSAAVKRTIASIDRIRRNVMAADITLEALVPEAWLLSAIGDTAAALRRVSATLDALGSVPASKFENPVTAGALVQCMLLRAELARRSAPRESIAWARAIEAISDTTKPHSWMRTRRWRPLTK